MTTYNTYQEAKIANPERTIHKYDGKFTDESISEYGHSLQPCNPIDHCMTVERFLGDGYEFVDGDAYINGTGSVKVVGEKGHSKLSCNDVRNICNSNKAFILRAAVLEEKDKPFLQTDEEFEHTKTLNFIYERLINVHEENPCYDYMHKLKNAIKMVEDRESPCNQSAAQEKPRTKVEYVKCGFDSAWEAVKAFEDGEELYTKRSHKDYILIDNAPDVLRFLYDLHELIETPMTEREAFVDSATHILESGMSDVEYARALFDSGEFKLVN